MRKIKIIQTILAVLLTVYLVACIMNHYQLFAIISDSQRNGEIQLVAFLLIIGFATFPFKSKTKEQPKQQKPLCNHHWGLVTEGFQYCKHCGIAIPAPVQKCEQHHYEIISKVEILKKGPSMTDAIRGDTVNQVVFVSRCTNCGWIKEDRINCNEVKCTCHP